MSILLFICFWVILERVVCARNLQPDMAILIFKSKQNNSNNVLVVSAKQCLQDVLWHSNCQPAELPMGSAQPLQPPSLPCSAWALLRQAAAGRSTVAKAACWVPDPAYILLHVAHARGRGWVAGLRPDWGSFPAVPSLVSPCDPSLSPCTPLPQG